MKGFFVTNCSVKFVKMPLGYKEMASQNMGAETEEIPEIRVKAAFNG